MRYQDWPKRLNAIISNTQNKPFEWGIHDCCIFAADVVKALTGIDYAAEFRGTYSTAIEALRLIQNKGSLEGIATEALGNKINPKLAQRGDIVLVEMEEHGEGLGVCTGRLCVGPAKDGLISLPMSKVTAAWRVN